MGLFSKKKKTAAPKPQAQPAPAAGSGNGDGANGNRQQKFHTRRKKKDLIGKMKIQGSVPATIVDAIHGDPAIVNTDKDYVQVEKLTIDGKTYYPVLVFDEDSFEDAGLADRSNSDALGQLSLGLKTSSGATGLLPIVTDDSLKNDYFGILPMHDAFEFLRSNAVFNNYNKGWLVGLLNIDNDVLTLKKTSLRLSMDDWWKYVSSKGKELVFKVDGDTVSVSKDLPSTSNPFAITSAEAAGGAAQDADDVNQSDDGSDGGDNGLAIDDIPVGGEDVNDDNSNSLAPNKDQFKDVQAPVKPQPPVQPQSQPAPVSQSPSSQPQAQSQVPNSNQSQPEIVNPNPVQQQVQRPQQQQPVPQSTANPNVVSPKSPDELDADGLTMDSKIRTLSDFNITVSDSEFVDAYLNKLTITKLPLADESNDPTGRIHHMNEIRIQGNLEMESALNTVKASMLQWFETQRSSVLDALRDSTKEGGALLAGQRKLISQLKEQLNNDTALRVGAKHALHDELKALADNVAAQKKRELQAAQIEIENQFVQRENQVKRQQDDLIDAQVAKEKNLRIAKMNDVKQRIHSIAQTAASESYMHLMQMGSNEYRKYQISLDHLHDGLLKRLDTIERQSRDDENKRIADQAALVQNDTTIGTLKEQLAEKDKQHQADMDAKERDYRHDIEVFKQQAASEREAALASIQGELKTAQQREKDANDRLTSQQQLADKQIAKAESDAKLQIDQVKSDSKLNSDKSLTDLKRMRNWLAVAVGISVVLFSAGGYVTGALVSKSNNQPQTVTTTPSTNNSQQSPVNNYYGYSPNSGSSSNNSSSSSSSSHQTTSNKDKK